MLALASLLGGIDPMALLGLFLAAVGCAVVGCSLAMALSIYGRKTHEVLLMTYLVLIVWIIAPSLLDAVAHRMAWRTARDLAHPAWSMGRAVEPLSRGGPGVSGARASGPDLGFLAACLVVASALTGLATCASAG